MTSDPHTLPKLESAALVTIDVQRDVLDGGGFPIPGTSDALPAMRRVVESFRRASRPIVHVVRIYERDGSNAEACRRQMLAAGAQLLVRLDGCVRGLQFPQLPTDLDLRGERARLPGGRRS